MQKTTLRQNVQNIDRKWYLIDAQGKTLGSLATRVANLLRGKDRVDFTPHSDGGDYVVILNAEKILLTGNKEQDKKYYTHSRYIGNLKSRTAGEMRARNPRKIIELAVSGMLPKNRLRNPQLKRLLLVIGDKNPYEAQKPELINF